MKSLITDFIEVMGPIILMALVIIGIIFLLPLIVHIWWDWVVYLFESPR